MPLKTCYVKAAVDLVLQFFPDEIDPHDDPRIWIPASLEPQKYEKEYKDTNCSYIQYWIAVAENNEVVGIIGLYTETFDEHESLWITWFCVKEDYQRQSIGRTLLSFCFSYAHALKKKYLRVYTDPKNPIEKNAQILYEKFGLHIVESEKYENIARNDVVIREALIRS